MKRLSLRHSYLAALFVLAPACVQDGENPAIESRELAAFGSCQELASYAKDHALTSLERYYAEILEQAKNDPCFVSNDCSTPGVDLGIPGTNESAEDDADEGADIPGEQSDGDSNPGEDPTGDSKDPNDGTPEHSGTNNQVSGVDEPDIVKSDGKRILAVQGSRIHHLDASGPSPVLTGSLEIEGSWGGGEIFLRGNKVILIDNASTGDLTPGILGDKIAPDRYYLPVVRIHEIDISDPANLKLTRRMHVVGSYNGARLVDNVARLVVQSAPVGIEIVDPWNFFWSGSDGVGESSDGSSTPGSDGGTVTPGANTGTTTTPPVMKGRSLARPRQDDGKTNLQRLEEAIAKARALNQAAISATDENTWLPSYALEDFSTGVVQESSGKLYDCTFAMHPGVLSGLDTLNVITLDLDQPLSQPQGTGIFASGGTIYANAQNLYVATMPWSPVIPLASGWPIGETMVLEDWAGDSVDVQVDPGVPETGVATGGGTMPSTGSVEFRAGADEVELVSTQIHKFAFETPRQPTYAGSGEVGGYLLNQFAMSEHEGNLRVAATTMLSGWNWNPDWQSESFVSVLAPTQSDDTLELKEIGKVGGLGRTEQIKSVRFVGNAGYVVTFRQTDPLYTLDLSVPTAPIVAGELKVEGYSAYLHPIGEGRLIGVGRDANAEGQIQGLQVSLFDVSNLAAPTRLANFTLENADSQVEWNHHAFLYWGAKELAFVPVQTWGIWNETTGTVDGNFNGVYALRINNVGIEKVGQIEHPAMSYPGGDGETFPDEGIPDEGIPEDQIPGEDLPGDEIPGDDPTIPEDPGEWTYVPAIQRSLVIGEVVYTLSEGGLKGNAIDGLAELSWVPFTTP
jgi:hypothetical protein